MTKRISEEAVKKSTGKSWNEWFLLLNKAGAKKLEHKAIAEMLHKKHGLSGWWSQMVTVQYEQEIKGRKMHEKPEGFQISKSKTFPFSLPKIFSAVQFPSQRKNWLKNFEFTITKSTKNKSIRGKWDGGKTNIEFQFYLKDNTKTQLVIQHSKISSGKEAEKLKTFWKTNLENLHNYLGRN
jgi:hypothetical protein